MSVILPYRIAFDDDDSEWTNFDIVEMGMNGIFFIDIVLNFFTAYYDSNENLVLDKKVIYFYFFNINENPKENCQKLYLFLVFN